MYRWVVFLHLVGVFGFLLAHGIPVFVSWRLRKERDLERIRALLNLSEGSMGVALGSLLVVLVSGIVAGFMGHWWGTGWIWASLGLLVALSGAMGGLGTPYHNQIRRAVGLPTSWTQGKKPPPSEGASPEQLEALLSSARPWLLSIIGIGGLLVVLWLMIFKPF